jgi:hypothetical protein
MNIHRKTLSANLTIWRFVTPQRSLQLWMRAVFLDIVFDVFHGHPQVCVDVLADTPNVSRWHASQVTTGIESQ